MELYYKTRGNSSLQGKPRVYFTAHPADYAPFLERISHEILELHNCTIWYDAAPDADYDEETLFSNLSQMQLFVVPVTTRFLCQENRALDVEFRFAT